MTNVWTSDGCINIWTSDGRRFGIFNFTFNMEFLVGHTPLISEPPEYFLSKVTIFSYIYKSFSFGIFPLHLTILIYLFVKQSVKQLYGAHSVPKPFK